jgi:hypothetical protein
MPSHEGGCLCGKVRFRVTAAAALDRGYCHCRMCQRNSGAPVVAWATFPVTDFAWIAGKAAEYRSSAEATRRFCASCGSYMVFSSMQSPGEISVNTASFDAPEAFPPRKHIFVESRLPWFRTADDLPESAGYGSVG